MTAPPYTDIVDRPLCLAAAEHLLAEREARYPALIEAGRISAAHAVLHLERARAIVAQWRWICDPATPPLPAHDPAKAGAWGPWPQEIAGELAEAAARAATIAERAPDHAGLRQLAELYAALAWYERPDDGSWPIVTRVAQARRATAEWRAIAAAQARRAA
jgi:hypothetical protein